MLKWAIFHYFQQVEKTGMVPAFKEIEPRSDHCLLGAFLVLKEQTVERD